MQHALVRHNDVRMVSYRCLPLSEHLTVYYMDSIVGYYWSYYEYHWKKPVRRILCLGGQFDVVSTSRPNLDDCC